jgi:putative SOS response-associated peptidase YedK
MPRVATEPETRVGMLLLAPRNTSGQQHGDKCIVLLTTGPNAVTSAIHDRMPVILDPDVYDLWLDPGMKDMRAASDVLKPYDTQPMRSHPVSTRINSVANDDEECSAPALIQNRLF